MSIPNKKINPAWVDGSGLYKVWAPGMPPDLPLDAFWTLFRTGQFPPEVVTQLNPEIIAQIAKAWIQMRIDILAAQLNPASVATYFNIKIKELFPERVSNE